MSLRHMILELVQRACVILGTSTKLIQHNDFASHNWSHKDFLKHIWKNSCCSSFDNLSNRSVSTLQLRISSSDAIRICWSSLWNIKFSPCKIFGKLSALTSIIGLQEKVISLTGQHRYQSYFEKGLHKS